MGLAPATVRAYSVAIANFILATPCIAFDDMDGRMMKYIETQPLLAQRGLIEKLTAAMRHFFPEVEKPLPQLSRYVTQLKREFRGRTKPPTVWDVLVVVMTRLIFQSFPTTVLRAYLQFDAFLRPVELFSMIGKHIAFLGGNLLGLQAKKVLVLLLKAKTGLFQSVSLRSEVLIQQLARLTASCESSVRRFPPYKVYRERITQALVEESLAQIGYTPYNIRHEAATMDLIIKGESALPGILYNGRWESSSAGKTYLHTGAAALLFAELPSNRCGSKTASDTIVFAVCDGYFDTSELKGRIQGGGK